MTNQDPYQGQQGGYGQSQHQQGYGQQGQYDPNAQYVQYDQAQAVGAQPFGAGQGTGVVQDSSPASFFKALFDFSFTTFITPKVVKFVYILAFAALVVAWLFFLLAAFSQSAGAGLAVLLFGPVGIILYLVFIRITLEFYLATVRMSEDIHQRLR